MRSFQGGRPSIYTLTDAIKKIPTPTLTICGDEDDNCIGPSLFLKQRLAVGCGRRSGETRGACESLSASPYSIET